MSSLWTMKLVAFGTNSSTSAAIGISFSRRIRTLHGETSSRSKCRIFCVVMPPVDIVA
jgi:hypothetical protein